MTSVSKCHKTAEPSGSWRWTVRRPKQNKSIGESVMRKAILASALVLFPIMAWAQMVPKPGPEVKKLDYFVGTWSIEGTVAQGPWGSGGKFTSQDKSDWLPGNFFVQCHSEFKMPPEVGGDGTETSYLGYDTDKNIYTFDAFSSLGRHEVSQGTVSGDTWTWNS